MTKYYYSPTTGAFYTPEVHGLVDRMPGDITEITEAEWQKLLAAQSSGKQIVAGTHGKPIAVKYRHTDEELAAELRRVRNLALAETDGLVARHRDELDMGLATSIETENYRRLVKWRQALRDITKHPKFPQVRLPERPV